MTDAILHWRTPDGIHRLASATDKTLSVDVYSKTDVNPSGEQGIDRVEFYVSENGGPATTHTASSLTMRTPNYRATPSRLPGGRVDGPAQFPGFGTVLDLEVLAAGTITVTFAVFSGAGTRTDHPDTLTIYNDTDGADRRPSTKEIHCDPASGTPGGAGTAGDPVQTLLQAFALSVNNPAGATSADRDAGGSRIVVHGAMVGSGGVVFPIPVWHTTGAWRVTVESVESNRTYKRTTEGVFTAPDDYLQGGGFGGSGNANVDFVGFEFVGPAITFFKSGTTNVVVRDFDCDAHSDYWTPGSTRPSAAYITDGANGDQHTYIVGGSAGITRRETWQSEIYGKMFGLAGYHAAFDFHIHHIIGVAIQTNNDEGDDPCLTSGLVENIKYTPNTDNTGVAGYADTSYDTVTGGANLVVTIPSAGKMRVDATSGSVDDFGTQLEEIIGNSYWGGRMSGFPSGGNNGTFPIEDAGTNGSGFPYAVFTNASAVAETGTATARVATARFSDGFYYTQVIHPDIWQSQGNHVGAALAHIRAVDIRNSRGWVGAGNNHTRLALENLTDSSPGPGNGSLQFDFTGSDLVDCLFFNLSIAAPAMIWKAGGTFTGTNFVDCVFYVAGSNFPTVGTFISHCHFETGPTYGLVPGSGTFWLNDVSVAPFDHTPTPANLNGASGLHEMPVEWRWPGAIGDSRGVTYEVGVGNWFVSTGGGSSGTPSSALMAMGVSRG